MDGRYLIFIQLDIKNPNGIYLPNQITKFESNKIRQSCNPRWIFSVSRDHFQYCKYKNMGM